MEKRLVVAMDEGDQQTTLPLSFSTSAEQGEPRKLKLAETVVYGKPTITLFDFGAIIDVVSTALGRKLYLEPGKTKRRITMVDKKHWL